MRTIGGPQIGYDNDVHVTDGGQQLSYIPVSPPDPLMLYPNYFYSLFVKRITTAKEVYGLHVGSPVAKWIRLRYEPPEFRIFTLRQPRTSMGARRSQKHAEADKQIEKALLEPSSGQFHSVREAAKANDVSHSTLLRRMNGGKSMAESREHQQILIIPEENALAECITRFVILGHPPRHAFICELVEEIWLARQINSS